MTPGLIPWRKKKTPFVRIQVKGIDEDFKTALENISKTEDEIREIIRENNDKSNRFDMEKGRHRKN